VAEILHRRRLPRRAAALGPWALLGPEIPLGPQREALVGPAKRGCRGGAADAGGMRRAPRPRMHAARASRRAFALGGWAMAGATTGIRLVLALKLAGLRVPLSRKRPAQQNGLRAPHAAWTASGGPAASPPSFVAQVPPPAMQHRSHGNEEWAIRLRCASWLDARSLVQGRNDLLMIFADYGAVSGPVLKTSPPQMPGWQYCPKPRPSFVRLYHC
jgi:hypothetical protein